jgi:trk system potassium uptake protein TrkA
VDRPLGETGLRTRYGITVVWVERPGEEPYATQYTELHHGDVIIVSGRIGQVEAFANRT